MTRPNMRRLRGALAAICLTVPAAIAAPVPVLAMQILNAADHAELTAQVSATNVNRIALHGDRIAKVVRAPSGYAVEHDSASGDLYLRPSAPGAVEDSAGDPVTLFIGTEKGFTYRLTLTPAARASAQILIRNAAALPDTAVRVPAPGDNAHVAALVKLVRAVARRNVLPGYTIHAGGRTAQAGLTLIETWRGPRFAALVFEAARPAPEGEDAAAGLAGTIGETLVAGRVEALWLAASGTGPSGGRLAVAVTEAVPGGEPR